LFLENQRKYEKENIKKIKEEKKRQDV